MLTVASSASSHPVGTLRGRLAGFAGFLHANGYGVGGDDSARVLDTAGRVGILDSRVLRWSLKAVLCGRGEEWRRFDGLFDAYFLPPNRKAFAQAAPAEPLESDGGRGQVASREESLESTAFDALHRAEDIRDIEALMRRFARRLKRLRLRREAASLRGRRLDLRSTIRRSVATGGTPVRLAWRERRHVRPRLVLLLDVSRSMSLYSFFWLRLARALAGELPDVHCFIFHTRITGVDEALHDSDPRRAQERLHLLAAGWGGGTRIGECLQDFNRDHGSRLVHSRTAVIVVSDGYDTGEPRVLGEALAQLRRRARRVVWLNPLLGEPGFSPVSGGMRAAMPHLDLLAPGGDLGAITRALPQVIEALR